MYLSEYPVPHSKSIVRIRDAILISRRSDFYGLTARNPAVLLARTKCEDKV